MTRMHRVYRLDAIPDPALAQYQLACGGDVRVAIGADFVHLLRMLAALPEGSASLTIRYVFDPVAGSDDPQQRLKVYLIADAASEDTGSDLAIILDRGPFRRFYDLTPSSDPSIPWDTLASACDVVRRDDYSTPVISPELNARIPAAYYAVWPFVPRTDNDYLCLDAVLSRVDSPVVLEIAIEPVDITPYRQAHTAYLAELQAINRPWDDEFRSDAGLSGWSESAERGGFGVNLSVQPFSHRDAMADMVSRQQQEFHETLSRPHLRFRMRVLAPTTSLARLLASVAAQGAFDEGSYRLIDVSLNGSEARVGSDRETGAMVTPADPQLRATDHDRLLHELRNLAPADELAGAFRLPMASLGSPSCIRKNTDPPPPGTDAQILFGSDQHVQAGSSSDDGGSVRRGVPTRSLAKHAFVCGSSGYGKTTSMFNLIIQCHQQGIPCLVIEPANSNYRELKRLKDSTHSDAQLLARDLCIYSIADEGGLPLRFNPLAPQPTESLESHIEGLLASFKGAMPMAGPLPALLGEAAERVFELHPDPARPPVMADLYAAMRQVLEEKGYDAEVTSNLRAALEVRISILTRRAIGRVFQCRESIPSIAQLMSGWSVVELAALPQEQACLLALILLTAVRTWARTTPRGSPEKPRLVVVVEEAHNIVGRNRDAAASEDNADPRAFAAQLICRMLAELRALGVAVVVVDQLPSQVAPEVIKNTSTKLAFRLVDAQDRECLGAAMLFGPVELEEIARMLPGEAYLYTEGFHGPRRIRTPDLSSRLGLGRSPVGAELLPIIQDEAWFVQGSTLRMEMEAEQLLEAMDEFDRVRDRLVVEVADLRLRCFKVAREDDGTNGRDRHTDLGRQAQLLRTRLDFIYGRFVRDYYRPLMQEAGVCEERARKLVPLRQNLALRHIGIVEPGVNSLRKLLDRLSQECQTEYRLVNQPAKESHHGQTQ